MHPLNPRALIGIAAILSVLAVAGLLAAQPWWANLAHAQDSPSAALELSAGSVEPGTAITVTMSFSNLEADSDTSTTDYVFRADVLDDEDGDADGCEGGGMGKDRYFYQVDEDPETRGGTVSADCPAGDYTIEVSLSSADDVELASASETFTIMAFPAPPTAPTDLTATLSAADITLTWTVPEINTITSYRVTRQEYTDENGPPAEFSWDTGNTDTSYTETSLKAGIRYVYLVRAINDGGVGPASEPIMVSAEDGVSSRTYTVTVTRVAPAQPSTDATLSGLTLSGVDFGAFDSATTDYTASVASDVAETTVTSTVNDDGATYVIKLGGVADADGVIPLSVGSNVITIKVTAGDGNTSQTYTVTVTVPNHRPQGLTWKMNRVCKAT